MKRWTSYLLLGIEALVLSALILTTRCTNYRDVFVGENIYFVDADCYSRMTRVRLCAQHPGLVLRHHTFENYPEGTTPHTTAPLDYAILFCGYALRSFTSRSIDLAGAFISPLLAILGGLFLCWWSRAMRLQFRWAMLILFVLSPILVHGTTLGRPDHQSLLILLVLVATCSDWTLLRSDATGWKLASGLAWGLAIWVSAYEPLILLLIAIAIGLAAQMRTGRGASDKASLGLTNQTEGQKQFLYRHLKWLTLGTVLLIALLVERRLPVFPLFAVSPQFANWSRTIGELTTTPLLSPIWFRWLGWLIVVAPFLAIIRLRKQSFSRAFLTIVILLFATFLLTIWQARWGYFLALLFVIALPELLGAIPSKRIAWILFVCALWPVLRDWDTRMWPEPLTAARQIEQRREAVELRELSLNMIATDRRPFLAPWWLSPAITYWSGQPGVAGSSHESLSGIAESARFFLTDDPTEAGEILRRREVAWVVSYDAERLEANSSVILGKPASKNSLARVLDQRSTQAPAFLTLSIQTGTQKLFQVTNKW